MRSTKAETQKRIRLVLEMLLQSTAKVDIVRFGVENWGITERGIEKYITDAYIIIDMMAKQNNEQAFAHSLAQRRYLKNKAIKNGDLRLAHDIIKDEDKLRNLYPAERLEHSGATEVTLKVVYDNGTNDTPEAPAPKTA